MTEIGCLVAMNSSMPAPDIRFPNRTLRKSPRKVRRKARSSFAKRTSLIFRLNGGIGGIAISYLRNHRILRIANDVQKLKILTSQERMNRFSDDPAVGPWNDGSLPCAIEAAFPLNSCEIAVSNAVPWSRTTPDYRQNLNPSKTMKNKAVRFWEDFLPLINPTHIITAGKVAKEVIKRANPEGHYCLKSVWLPSPRAMSTSGMFDVDDLLKRYPEVQQVVQSNHFPEWFQTYKRNKVFFACHVVSRYGQNDG